MSPRPQEHHRFAERTCSSVHEIAVVWGKLMRQLPSLGLRPRPEFTWSTCCLLFRKWNWSTLGLILMEHLWVISTLQSAQDFTVMRQINAFNFSTSWVAGYLLIRWYMLLSEEWIYKGIRTGFYESFLKLCCGIPEPKTLNPKPRETTEKKHGIDCQ